MIYNNKDLKKKVGRPGRGGDGQEEEGTAKKEREAQKQGGLEKGMRLLCDQEGLAHSRPRARGLFSLGPWAARFCVFFIPKTSYRLIRAQLLDPLSTNSL